MTFDINQLKKNYINNNRFAKQIDRLKKLSINTLYITKTVNESVSNFKNNINSFVIYGDPQSGKTEMMIALTAKLLDEGNKIIIILINDNVGLLEQNLRRFADSGLDPDPKNFREILDDIHQIKDHEWVIFCKKNSSDLQKLIRKISKFQNKIIIDDEADFATPNSKIKKNEKSTINKHIEELLENNGKYIGVTATPARLDVNNTFNNQNTKWVYFEPHEKYVGQEIFFPISLNNSLRYKLEFLPEEYDKPEYLRKALFRFLVNVAYLNIINNEDQHYSMLIHTSGKKIDHYKDYEEVVSITNKLKDELESSHEKFWKDINKIASENFYNYEDRITQYIYDNRSRNKSIIINSEKDKENLEKAADPVSLFTIAIGGNIVSRGVTFNNLLSMYFTRNVKSKLQQDTYIQRARMFGVREKYIKFFELTIPENLWQDWHRCFLYHKLALESVKNGNPPIWIGDKRIQTVAPSSIDKSNIEMDSGEMSYGIFNLTNDIRSVVSKEISEFEKLNQLKSFLNEEVLPQHLIGVIKALSPDGMNSLVIHSIKPLPQWSDVNQDNISRTKGFIGMGNRNELEKDKYPHAIHHIFILYNTNNKARIFYKFIGINGIKFLKNLKNI